MNWAIDGPTVFPVGRDMLQWQLQGGRPERAGWWVIPAIRWQSFWFERNLALQRRLPPPVYPGRDPVFILGLWRSGTTFLHELLGTCPGMIYPTTWQCMSPASFRFRSPPDAGKAVVRPMDGFTIDVLSPQEDEFALLALGVPSVYRGFFDPRRLAELAGWLKPDAWDGSRPEGWMAKWREFLAGVADGKPGRLLLKSPGHTFRTRALLEAFPDAAYVWVVRDPVEVFFSNRKMWLSMFQRYALWSWNMFDLDAFLRQAFDSAARCLAYATRELPTEKLAVVDFARLTRAPAATLGAVIHQLRLGNLGQDDAGIKDVAAGKAGYRADAYDGQTLPPPVAAVLDRLRMAQQAALTTHGVQSEV